MPKLWNETIEAHRHSVREAILDTTWALVREHGLLSVTMSQIAEETGIGRATLYKYFPDVEAILIAWHHDRITDHLTHLAKLRDQAGAAAERLAMVLEAYALICHRREHHGPELAALLHRGKHVAGAQRQILDLFRDLLSEIAEAGELRDDVAPDELASYCLHALTAAGSLPSEAAVRRLVRVTLAGLRCSPGRRSGRRPALSSSGGNLGREGPSLRSRIELLGRRVPVAPRLAEGAALYALLESGAEPHRTPVLAAELVADVVLGGLALLLEQVLDQPDLAVEPPLVLVLVEFTYRRSSVSSSAAVASPSRFIRSMSPTGTRPLGRPSAWARGVVWSPA